MGEMWGSCGDLKRANHEFLPLSVNELRPGVGGKFI